MTTLFGYDIGDWSDITDLFSSGDSSTPSDPNDPWSMKNLFTPKNIVGAVNMFGQSRAKADAADASQAALDQKYAQENAMADKTFQQQVELLKLKAALSGGGGGGGGGTDMRPYIYQGKLGAIQSAKTGRQEASGLTVSALKNLIEAAQRPLVR